MIPTGQVTLLFSDIQGSTALLNELGDRFANVLDEHDRIFRAAIAEYGGYEFSNEGDAFGVAFADPLAAAEAALAVQRRMAEATWPGAAQVRVRMGLHHGEPKVRGHDYWGEDVHFAARICAAAHGGQVIMSAAMTAALATDRSVSLGHHGLKDFPTPRELFQLVASGEPPEEFPAPRTLSSFRSNLPSISTPVIGREGVLTELAGLFADGQRLVTLTGAGGMGKTRVAVALGEHIGQKYPDGVAFVALAEVDAAQVDAAVADATGAPRGGEVRVALLEHLQRRRMLVILDNCEHVVDAAASLASSILERCPGIAILATAQLPLDLAVETVRRLEPLATQHRSDGQCDGTAAATMFIARARAHDGSFRVSGADRPLVEALCELLGGLPLAIELASARVRLFGIDRLLAALRRDLDALAAPSRDLPERQRSLRAALGWTLSLLSSSERAVFTALGAFAGSWSLEEAELLLADELDEMAVWEALTRLLDASLVVVRGDGRFAMPQRVRQHAAELLAAAPAGDRHRRRHGEVIGLELRDLHLEMFVDYRRMLANIVDLLPEARHALSWTREHSPDAYRHLIGLTAPALATTGNLALVADDLESFAPPADPETFDDAAISYALGLLHAMRWSTDTAGEVGHFDAAERGFLACGDARAAVVAMYGALCALEAGGVQDGVTERCAAQLSVAQQISDPRWRAEVTRLNTVGWDDSASLDLVDRVAADLGVGTGGFAVMSSNQRFHIALRDGDLTIAAYWLRHALQTHPRDQLYSILNAVKGLSWLLVLRHEDVLSLELRTAVDAIYRSRTGSDHRGFYQSWIDGFAESRARLAEDEITRAESRGLALSYDELVERATEVARRCASAPVGERSDLLERDAGADAVGTVDPHD